MCFSLRPQHRSTLPPAAASATLIAVATDTEKVAATVVDPRHYWPRVDSTVAVKRSESDSPLAVVVDAVA